MIEFPIRRRPRPTEPSNWKEPDDDAFDDDDDDDDDDDESASHACACSVRTISSLETKTYAVEYIRLMQDDGRLIGWYTGSLEQKSHLPHGQGRMEYLDSNTIYEGQWIHGDWCGYGVLTDTSTGACYHGGFFDNCKHGLGVMQYADGRTYEGTFQLDKISGKGQMSYPDGSKYWGYWNEEGLPHGRGKKYYPDGRVYDGEFDQGLLSGHGRMTYPDGTWYLGEWSDGQYNGLGMLVKNDGSLAFEGTFCNGQPAVSSSFPLQPKSDGRVLLYRSSNVVCQGTLVGPLPKEVSMRNGAATNWILRNHLPDSLIQHNPEYATNPVPSHPVD